MKAKNKVPWRTTLAIVIIAVIVPWIGKHWETSQSELVVYCAHDSIFADSIIRDFETNSGIRVRIRFDEETNKSLGLTNLLIAEKKNPRCDVFWNNQTLGMIRLKNEEVLATCDASLFVAIPSQFKDADNQWAGFAARLRVFIINTDKMEATEDAVSRVLTSNSLSKVAIALPMFGTTLSHYSVLCDQMGLAGLKNWHQSLRVRGIREARGNGAVKDLVAEGVCDLGFTDTDDAFAAIDAGKPVKMLPVRLASGNTICIPNSVAMIRNCAHPQEAEQFIRYLLSPEVELALARSASRQIPLGSIDKNQLPEDVRELSVWAADTVSLQGAAKHDQEVLDWLSDEYVGQ